MKKFKVKIGYRWHYFASLEEAKEFCEFVFGKSGIVLGIEAAGKSK